MEARLSARCECGHLHPEHGIAGACRGCTHCVVDEASDHPYARCDCQAFRQVAVDRSGVCV